MYTYIFQTYTRDRNWAFIDVIFLFVHNMFRPIRAILRWNTIYYLYISRKLSILQRIRCDRGYMSEKYKCTQIVYGTLWQSEAWKTESNIETVSDFISSGNLEGATFCRSRWLQVNGNQVIACEQA
jgi:hypothetical protein